MMDDAGQLVISVGSAAAENVDFKGETTMRAVVERSCEVARSGVDWWPEGDLAGLGAGRAAGRLVGPWIQAVYWEIRRRNADRSTPLRLAVGLDVADGPGSARALRESTPATWLLTAVPRATLLVALSDRVHDAVLEAGSPRFERQNISRAMVSTPTGPEPGWFQLTGHPTPAVPAAAAGTAAPTPRRRRQEAPAGPDGDYRISVAGDGYTFRGSTFHGTATIGSRGDDE